MDPKNFTKTKITTMGKKKREKKTIMQENCCPHGYVCDPSGGTCSPRPGRFWSHNL